MWLEVYMVTKCQNLSRPNVTKCLTYFGKSEVSLHPGTVDKPCPGCILCVKVAVSRGTSHPVTVPGMYWDSAIQGRRGIYVRPCVQRKWKTDGTMAARRYDNLGK